MKRTLLVILSVALLSSTGCGGPFSCFRRGDDCHTQPCGYTASYGNQQVCHSGVLGGQIIGDGAMIDGGMPVEIQGVRPGPAAEGVAPGRANP